MQAEDKNDQHPLTASKGDNTVANSGHKKHSGRRGRGGRRKSSAAITNSNIIADITLPTRRKSSSNARYFTKHHKEQENKDESEALHSLKDIISEMKRIPSVVTPKPNNTLNTTWKRVRRHSEPPNKHQIISQTTNHHHLTPIHENNKSAPLFSNSFLALEEDVDGENTSSIEILVSPLSENNNDHLTLPPKRSRSKSVPNRLPDPNLLSTSSPVSSTRKLLYPAHLNVSEASALVRSRVLYSGILKVDMQDSSEANVECEELGASIYIFGSRNRNRALDGDEVAVELVNVDDMLSERKTKRQVRQTRRLSVISQSSHHHSLSSIPEDTIDLESEIESMKSRPKFCGKVVCILERPKNMLFSGTLSLNRPHGKLLDNSSRDRRDSSPKIIWFIPADKRLPLVAVPIKHAPPDFTKYHEEYKNRIFIGNMQRWPASSLHPFGTIEKEIGWMGELGVHSAALMADHHIKDMDFSESVLNAAKAIPQSLTPHDKKGRRDLTDEHIFTLSSLNNHDLDYAFSIKSNEDGVYEVGIHISDVAHFVRLMTPLDREARERSCSVNLIDRKISILPPSFTKQHCSFEVNQDRLAYSVLCRMTDKGVLLHAWVGKTVINVKENIDPFHLKNNTQLLKLCEQLQQKRLTKSNGLSLARSYEVFDLAESGYPKEIHRVDQTDQDVLVEELLILANTEIGQKICRRFPDQALLYRQDRPKLSKIAAIQDYFENEPLPSSIQGLLKLVEEKEMSSERQSALIYMIRKSIPACKYYSAGGLDISKYYHYGYGSAICAVATNPIHNYAAIHTQRQLSAALKGEEQESENFDEIDKIARHCNSSQLSKEAAEQDSKKLYIAAYIYRQCLNTNQKQLLVNAIVIGLNVRSIDLYIPEYDLDITVPMNEQSVPKAHCEYDAKLNQFAISWKSDDTNSDVVAFLSQLQIYIQVDMKEIRPVYEIELARNIRYHNC